jgi:hypothetical protein
MYVVKQMETVSNTEDILCFYTKSADKVPGKGVGEHLSDPSSYGELAKIPHWRRMLSTLYSDEPFKYNGATFTSTEHALMREKFSSANMVSTARMFERESGSEIAISTGLVARKNRKIEIMTNEQLAYWDSIRRDKKKEIYGARFSSGICYRALLCTGTAQLWSRGPRISPIRSSTLETIRNSLE